MRIQLEMDTNLVKNKLKGCYVTIPTPFEDKDNFPVNYSALREYTRFLLDNGLDKNYATYWPNAYIKKIR